MRNPTLLQHRSFQGVALSPTKHGQHVARTFALSYDQLTSSDPTDALALALLARAAYFAPGELIPRAVLVAACPMAGDTSRSSVQHIEDAFIRLVDLGLISPGEQDTVRLHRLVAAFIQEVAHSSQAQSDTEEAVYDTASKLYQTGNTAGALQLQVHMSHLVEIAGEREDERIAHLCGELGLLLNRLGDYAHARQYFEQALVICEHTLDLQHPNTLTSMINLAGLLWDLGEYEAARLYIEQVLQIEELLYGSAHPNVAGDLNALGSVLQDQGEYAAARPLFERALQIWEQTLGASHPDTASSLNNLAVLLKDQGEYAAARPLLERALAIREQTLGARHPDTAQSLNNLAVLLQEQGEYAAARLLYERALQIYEQTLGPQHPATQHSRRSLAAIEQRLRQHQPRSWWQRLLGR